MAEFIALSATSAEPGEPFGLRRGYPVGLRLRRGTPIRCVTGTLWVTEEGHPEDIVLEGGMRYVVRSGGPLVLHATTPAAVARIARPTPARLRSSRPSFLLALLGRMLGAGRGSGDGRSAGAAVAGPSRLG